MKTLIKAAMTGAALSGVLLLSAGAVAMGHHPGHNPERMLAHMTEKLELTETQQTQIEALLAENRSAMQADRQRMDEIRDSLKAMRADFDAGQVTRLTDELGEITSRMAYSLASTQADVYQLLTAEQREEMDELQAAREKRMQKRRPGRD